MTNSVEQADALISQPKKGYYNFSNYCPTYLFTTENIKAVIGTIDLSDKSVLTVSSSGDHVFNMLLSGAKNIDCYDINNFTKYYFYFKESAIRTLDYKEFIDFFFSNKLKFRDKVFDELLFLRVLSNIRDEESLFFWKNLYDKYGSKKLYYSNLFIQNHYFKNTYIECNNYLNNSNNYEKLQKILETYNYNFYLIDIFNDINKLPNNRYDFIYLSNILDKIGYIDELSYVKKIKELITKLRVYLSNDGILGVCYLYFYLDDYWDSSNKRRLNSFVMRSEYFYDDSYTFKTFRGINNLKSKRIDDMDGLMLVKKK